MNLRSVSVLRWIVVVLCVATSVLTGETARAACPPGQSTPITSGGSALRLPVYLGTLGPAPRASFYILGSGGTVNSGTLPASAWLHNVGDLDGDGLPDYRIDAPGEGPGGWGDPLTNGCPSTLDSPHPPLVIVITQEREDLDGDGVFDVFEDLNHNNILDAGEDRDGDGRLTPPDGCEGALREDVDCDGRPDLIYEDANNNHHLDPGEDIDGDGRLDYIDEDVNHNGKLDPGEDRNGNGRLDTFNPAFPNIPVYIEDRNGNQNLDDRVHPRMDDMIFGYVFPPDGPPIPTTFDGFYPYGSLKPAPGGVIVVTLAWDGTAYDLSRITTPTRIVQLPGGGGQVRFLDASPLDRLVPAVSGVRRSPDATWRMRFDVPGTDLADELAGTRGVFDSFLLSFLTRTFRFMENG